MRRREKPEEMPQRLFFSGRESETGARVFLVLVERTASPATNHDACAVSRRRARPSMKVRRDERSHGNERVRLPPRAESSRDFLFVNPASRRRARPASLRTAVRAVR